jgi:hypothetical protein
MTKWAWMSVGEGRHAALFCWQVFDVFGRKWMEACGWEVGSGEWWGLQGRRWLLRQGE